MLVILAVAVIVLLHEHHAIRHCTYSSSPSSIASSVNCSSHYNPISSLTPAVSFMKMTMERQMRQNLVKTAAREVCIFERKCIHAFWRGHDYANALTVRTFISERFCERFKLVLERSSLTARVPTPEPSAKRFCKRERKHAHMAWARYARKSALACMHTRTRTHTCFAWLVLCACARTTTPSVCGDESGCGLLAHDREYLSTC